METLQQMSDKPKLLSSLLPQDDAERKLWKRLRHHQLGVLFRRRHRLGSDQVDFYCPDAAVVVVVHHEAEECPHQAARIQAEDERFRRFGLETLRFRSNEIEDAIDRVVVEIFRAVQYRLMTNVSLA